jgi:ATP/maltotriose-dependent transcriptional regulator MalT
VASYREASQRGRDPQPGFALLRLSQGEPALAAGAVRAALSACAEPLERARFLPASVEILLASGALEEAAGAADELQAYAGRLGGEALHAIAGEARARIALARGDATTALAPLRSAFATWQKLDAPYIAARLRAQIACACEALGDVEGARLEREAARAAFERLGARLDLAALETGSVVHAQASDAAARAGLTPREHEVLCLLASGKTNKQMAKELFLSEKTVDRHVSNLFGKLEVGSRSAATAWAYEHGLFDKLSS